MSSGPIITGLKRFIALLLQAYERSYKSYDQFKDPLEKLVPSGFGSSVDVYATALKKGVTY